MSEIVELLILLVSAFLLFGLLSLLSYERWFADLIDWFADKVPRRRSTSGSEALIGALATVEKAFLRRHDRAGIWGTVKVRGELWRARLRVGAAAEPAPGDQVRIVAVEGLTLDVESASAPAVNP
jgi:membrane protein implicated in regulation of membrane protease activity